MTARLNRNIERKRMSEGSGSCRLKREPSIVYSTLTNAEVKRRTEFQTKSYLTGFIIIVCNADHDKMKKKITLLTWFKEWFLYFEVIWGDFNTVDGYIKGIQDE